MPTTFTDAPDDTGPVPRSPSGDRAAVPGEVLAPEIGRDGGTTHDPPALRRLLALDLTPTSVERAERVEDRARRMLGGGPARPAARFGYQPGLDGLRALVGDRRDPLSRRLPVDPRRLGRRGGVLRRLRVPDHVAAARRARAQRGDRSPGLLAAPGPPPAAGAGRHAGGCRRRHPGDRLGRPASRAAPRPAVGGRLPRQLGSDRRRRPVLRRRAAAAPAPLESGDRGAVLPPLAVGVHPPRPLPPDPPVDRPTARRRRGHRRGGGLLAARRRAWPARRARWRRPGQLPVPVDVHPGRRPDARRCGGVRVAAVAGPRGGAGRGRADPRRRRRSGDRRTRLHRRGRCAHRGLRLPVAAAARVGPRPRRRAGGRAPGSARDAHRHGLVAARRHRRAQLRPVPLALADLRAGGSDRGLARTVRRGLGDHGRRDRAVLPLRGDAGADRGLWPVVADGRIRAWAPAAGGDRCGGRARCLLRRRRSLRPRCGRR